MQEGPSRPLALVMQITIVGALKPDQQPTNLDGFIHEIEKLLFATFPEFLPAHPPVTVVVADVRDDWIKRP